MACDFRSGVVILIMNFYIQFTLLTSLLRTIMAKPVLAAQTATHSTLHIWIARQQVIVFLCPTPPL